MPKLTDTQLVILSAAAQRDGGTVLPLPESLKINKAAAARTIKSLTNRGLIFEQPAGEGDPEDPAFGPPLRSKRSTVLRLRMVQICNLVAGKG